MKYVKVNEDAALEQYDEMLNELYKVDIAGIDFEAARVLKELDPIAYRVYFSDWLDSAEMELE